MSGEPLQDPAPTGSAPDASADVKAQADKLVAEGKKAIALKDWEAGVEKYAGALDLMRELVGDFDPAMAPLLLSYGKALFELAFASAGVMGKEEVEKTALAPGREEEGPSGSNFVFEGDVEGDDDDEEEAERASEDVKNAEAGPSTSIAAATSGEGEVEGEGEGEGEGQAEGDGEPEDDWNAAWEVLDVARTIYSKIVEDKKDGEGKEERLCLAECYVALGDVSSETENFPQAASDYGEALKIQSALLPASSRTLASVHYQLATVLEFLPNGRVQALQHVEEALRAFQARLAELDSAKDDQVSEEVGKMNAKEKENEKKDVQALIGDLEVKIEELKSAPAVGDPVSESIKHLLGGGEEGAFGAGGSGSGSTSAAPVNDLTGMVKKKKKRPAADAAEVEANGKGKEVEGGDAKKPRTE